MAAKKSLIKITILSLVALYLSACASGSFKARQQQRDKIASTSGLYCEFISGDEYPDVDVEVNIQMAKKCDANKHFSIANYKSSSENYGIVFCCGHAAKAEAKSDIKMDAAKGPGIDLKSEVKALEPAAPTAPEKTEKKDEKKTDKK